MILRFLLLCVVTSCLAATSFGCAEKTAEAARAATPAECRVVANGTTMTSPISNKTITKQTNTPAALYEGKLYFFCCEIDRDKFLTQPATFSQGVLPPNARVLEM